MGSSSGSGKWRKARLALGCIQLPPTLDDTPSSSSSSSNHNNNPGRRRLSDVAAASSPTDCHAALPMTPTPSSSGLVLSSRSSKSSKKTTCAICLNTMIPGHGHAIFTAECSHSFHFSCITSNVKHGNRICPVCRAKWKEIPFQSQSSELPVKLTTNANGRSRDDSWMSALHPVPILAPDPNQLIFHASEPDVFNDDDPIEHQDDVGVGQSVTSDSSESSSSSSSSMGRRVEVNAYPEVAAIPKSAFRDEFTILIHLKAPVAKVGDHMQSGSTHSRAPVDLVTVLDVSGSMAGTKLALLKRAMGFVIQHLGPHDRLSVIAFSSAARRVLPLRRMTDNGRRQALQAVNSLSSNGGTNIAEGLRKGAKVMLDRKSKNPVSSIILLSDGQDTYANVSRSDYKSLLPVSIQSQSQSQSQVPVHTFGFGTDHDSVSMHSISEASGGTFSFIEAESVVQDAFAQCMGGLLSVVAQELEVEVESAYDAHVRLGCIKAGSYHSKVMGDAGNGVINVGDLYAEEERNFLVTVNVPRGGPANEMPLLRINCSYKDPITNESVRLPEAEQVKILRPETVEVEQVVSMEVDRQRNRLNAAEAMSRAMSAAEQCDLGGAVSILDTCQKTLSESVSAKAGDPLCVALGNELKEMQDRMANRQVYEASGRAYVLSGLSSHSWQRATARGDSTSSTNLSQAYQTSNMAHMITRSQTMVFGALSTHPSPPVRPPRSLSTRSNAR